MNLNNSSAGLSRTDRGAACLRNALAETRRLPLSARLVQFSNLLEHSVHDRADLYRRPVAGPTGRETLVRLADGSTREMLMFGSNNYLGLANHPRVREAVRRALDTWGTGVAGPPHLNGTLLLHRELESRLADLKGQEDAMIFPTGYGANLGLVSALMRPGDRVLHDEKHHASFIDGCRLARADARSFPHNDVRALSEALQDARGGVETLVGVEGVYSMDGDLAPLAAIAEVCRPTDALLIVDDAHGTGVIGPGGRGAAAQAGVEDDVDAVMGTFSKTFAVVGGFVAGSRPLIDWLRFYARSYMFSASLPPMVVAAVLAGLDIIAADPEPRERLWANVDDLRSMLRSSGVDWAGESPICSLPVPAQVDVHEAAALLHRRGLFVNAIVYPAVAAGHERFRISLGAEHTHEDLEQLVEGLVEAGVVGSSGAASSRTAEPRDPANSRTAEARDPARPPARPGAPNGTEESA